MQSDDRRIDRLIARLESRLASWDKLVSDLLPRNDPLYVPTRADVKYAEKRLEAKGVRNPLGQVVAMLAPVCDEYLSGDAGARRTVFECVHAPGRQQVLRFLSSYPNFAAQELAGKSRPGSLLWLRRGLAGAAIENFAIDCRDTLMSLLNLYRAGRDAGIDVRAGFEAAAELDIGEEPKGAMTGWTVRGVLSGFYEHYGHNVDAHLDFRR